tara:strand:+ start:41 stop:877 length:837 start_codon:yes stop_codon:yes gene_type:complete
MNCKIISCYFGGRKEYPYNEKNTITVLEDVIRNECTLNPGVPQLDTILVNHDCGKKDGNEYLNSIDGLDTYSGKIKVIHRPWDNGIGASFGSFNWAFEEFRDEYDYWFFQEDDYKIIYDKYYARGIKMLENDSDLGFVGYDRGTNMDRTYATQYLEHFFQVILTDVPSSIVDKYMDDIKLAETKVLKIYDSLDINDLCHGGMGLTHKNTLNKVYELNGSLPYYDKPNPGTSTEEYNIWWWLFVFLGELQFPNSFPGKISLFDKTNDSLIHTYKDRRER